MKKPQVPGAAASKGSARAALWDNNPPATRDRELSLRLKAVS